MIDLGKIEKVVSKAALASLKRVKVSRVYGEPTTDSDGRDALHVTIVIRENKKAMSGDEALNAIVRIQQDLRKSGEERFPIVDFVTEQELASNAGAES